MLRRFFPASPEAPAPTARRADRLYPRVLICIALGLFTAGPLGCAEGTSGEASPSSSSPAGTPPTSPQVADTTNPIPSAPSPSAIAPDGPAVAPAPTGATPAGPVTPPGPVQSLPTPGATEPAQSPTSPSDTPPPSPEPAASANPQQPSTPTEPGPVPTGDDPENPLQGVNIGWNLGNSLDAPEGETAWGNPAVSEALIEAVAQAGFGAVRIPVSWSLHLGPGPDFAIDAAWLQRVDEVVRYVTDRQMAAIINLHHDGADDYDGVEWLTLTAADGTITEANNQAVEAQFVAVWSQIAEHFKDHGHYLVFESMNEIHDGYDTPKAEYHPIINALNQRFVDLIRASGGNNATRTLVVPGYNTNIDHTLTGFVLPTDTVPNKLVLSIHFYDPWSFAGEGSTSVWGAGYPGTDSWGQEDYVDEQFGKLKATYVDQGVPVLIGEYGAVNTSNNAPYRRYYIEYVTKAAHDRDLLPVYWDNGGLGEGTDKFGLIDRSNNQVATPEILEAMMRAATSDYGIGDIAKP